MHFNFWIISKEIIKNETNLVRATAKLEKLKFSSIKFPLSSTTS